MRGKGERREKKGIISGNRIPQAPENKNTEKEEEERKGEEGPAGKQRLMGLKQTFAKCADAHL